VKLYNCVKTVKAAKIFRVDVDTGEVLTVTDDRSRLTVFRVGKEWIDKHQPKVGGYFVEYEDGYRSYSPADAFEKGYVAADADTFEAAWQPFLDAGYRFGTDAIGNVKFGWGIAKGLVKPAN